MATTTNYGWDTPDDTDLVKDGAAAIRTLGSSVDTTTKALNPSTTLGDIEYRSATADTNTRLAIGSNGDILTVSSGVPAWVAAGSSVPANDGAIVNTQQSTTSTSYTDLATAGPAVTVTTGTRALVIVTAQITSSTANSANIMSFAVSGATTIAAADAVGVAQLYGPASTVDTYPRMSAASYVTLTAGSNTFTAKYATSTGTAFFRNRQIFVINLD
jgi:hypothetical protein